MARVDVAEISNRVIVESLQNHDREILIQQEKEDLDISIKKERLNIEASMREVNHSIPQESISKTQEEFEKIVREEFERVHNPKLKSCTESESQKKSDEPKKKKNRKDSEWEIFLKKYVPVDQWEDKNGYWKNEFEKIEEPKKPNIFKKVFKFIKFSAVVLLIYYLVSFIGAHNAIFTWDLVFDILTKICIAMIVGLISLASFVFIGFSKK